MRLLTDRDILARCFAMLADYCPETPTRRQTEFLLLADSEALYGGAAGGGKSSALLMASIMFAWVPGYASLVLRRTYPDLALPGAIMDRAHEWLTPTDATWDNTKKTWTFPSGAKLTFGHLQYSRDRFRYQSSEFQTIAFDELTQFEERDYTYVLSRLRRTVDIDVPLRARSGSNPGDIGHEWVRARFVDKETRGDRVFLPARLEDNPFIDTEEYESVALGRLDPVTRRQLRFGDWDVRDSGGVFERDWFEVVDRAPNDLDVVIRSWDEAASQGRGDWTVGALVGRKGSDWYVIDVVRDQRRPQGVDQMIDSTAQQDGWRVPILVQQEGGSAGKARVYDHAQRLDGYDVRVFRPTGDKVLRARPMASAAERGGVKLVRASWNRAFLDEAQTFPDGHDDQVDAVSAAIIELAHYMQGSPEPAPDASTLMGGANVHTSAAVGQAARQLRRRYG